MIIYFGMSVNGRLYTMQESKFVIYYMQKLKDIILYIGKSAWIKLDFILKLKNEYMFKIII